MLRSLAFHDVVIAASALFGILGCSDCHCSVRCFLFVCLFVCLFFSNCPEAQLSAEVDGHRLDFITVALVVVAVLSS